MRLLRSTALSLLLGACVVPMATLGARAQIVIRVEEPPPPLPIYEQPAIPASGYIWTPGYWSYDDDYGYYWVPGTWVEAPRPGLLWTPGYWGYENGQYGFRGGYWGEEVGFYGGVDYGYGYGGDGYAGGRWQGDHFFYNRSVNNFSNVHITNVYSQTIVNNNASRVSFNGGQGGLQARPTAQQQTFAQAQHVQPTSMQRQHVQMAQRDPALRESVNKGRPAVAATSRPNQFKGAGVVQAKTAGSRPAGQEIPHGKAPPASGPSNAAGHALPGSANGHALPGQAGPGGTRGEHQGPAGDKVERPSAATPHSGGAGTARTPNAVAPAQHDRAPAAVQHPPRTEQPPRQEQRMQAPRQEQRMQAPRQDARPPQEQRMAPPRAEPRMPGGGGAMQRGGGEPHPGPAPAAMPHPGGGGAPHPGPAPAAMPHPGGGGAPHPGGEHEHP